MYCGYLLKEAKAGNKNCKEGLFLANSSLIFCFMRDFRVKKDDRDDFAQLCYIAFNQALESYPIGGVNSFLSYYRRSVLHQYYLYKLNMCFPSKISHRDYGEILTSGFDYERFVNIQYFDYDGYLLEAENAVISKKIWEEVSRVVGEFWCEFLKLRFVEGKTHEELIGRYGWTDPLQSRSKQSYLFKKLKKSDLLKAIAKDCFEIKM